MVSRRHTKQTVEASYARLRLNSKKVLFLLLIEFIFLLFIDLRVSDFVNLSLSVFAIFLFPGMLLISTVIKGSSEITVTYLAVFSFSTSVLMISLIATVISYFVHPVEYVLLHFALVTILGFIAIMYVLRKKELTITFSRAEIFHISLSATVFLFLAGIFFNLPHYPSPDETIYLLNARYLLLTGKLLGISYSYWRNALVALFLDGRYLWSSILGSFVSFANVDPAHASLIGFIFLFGIILAIPLLLPPVYRNNILSRFLSLVFGLASPFVMNSSFAMSDIPATFYSTVSIALFMDVFVNTRSSKIVKFDYLTLALMLEIVSIMIKPTPLVLASSTCILAFYMIRYKLYKVRRYALLTASVLAPVLYELFIDIPRNMFLYVIKNEYLAQLLSKYIISVSPAELVIVNLSRLLTYTYADYLVPLYMILSPGALSLIVVSTAIISVWIGIKYKVSHLVILFSFTWITILFIYIFSLLSGITGDIIRYSLPVYPCVISLAAVSCSQIINRTSSRSIILVVPVVMLMFTFLNIRLVGYSSVAWGPSIDSLKLSMLQLIIFALIVLLFPVKITRNAKIISRTIRFDFLDLAFLFLLVSAVLVNTHNMSIDYQAIAPTSRNYGQTNIFGRSYNASLVFTNAYGMFAFMPDDLLINRLVFSFPQKNELEEISVGNYTLLISNSYNATWLNEIYVGQYPRNLDIPAGADLLRLVQPSYGTNFYIYSYSLEANKTLNQQQSERISVQSSRIYVYNATGTNADSIQIALNLTSSFRDNVTVLIGTLEFSKIFKTLLLPGENFVRLSIPSFVSTNFGRFAYGALLTRWANILLIDGEGRIVYGDTVTWWNFTYYDVACYFVLLMMIIAVICALLASISKRTSNRPSVSL